MRASIYVCLHLCVPPLWVVSHAIIATPDELVFDENLVPVVVVVVSFAAINLDHKNVTSNLLS